MRRRAQAGVTLMEVLIAVTLVSLLSVGILMAMRVGLSAMEKANTRLMANRRVIGAQRALEQQIANLMPVTADCRPAPDAPPSKQTFFQGEPESMRFVSSYSLEEAWRGHARIIELQVLAAEDGRGVRLIVNEPPYTGPELAGLLCLGRTQDPILGSVLRFQPIQAGPRSFVLADRLARCRFAYQESVPPPVLQQWVPHWVKPGLPTAVRVEMAPLEADPSRLQVVTVVAPVRVNRNPLEEYYD